MNSLDLVHDGLLPLSTCPSHQ